ncbi:GNAT family N-acetyltransferase [Chitinophaga pinensis]|uniref:GCN5-related N-acetyltransferase n=1 Tax=Chitinophaga pinensis (strain ATCC 43595 / DSM 2588 / LMG 13176 / NBRC 15968 / NCIMB 11800 / UQM 2034) TaxID=485918 RepID=A0A979H046_CHIPD|nr:N-acetyltransferase [Chitinophaga pinensis]ACU64476.1 GCN5-related N-acetyltransferase [Chitinophaga pinensis DSM 2588]
MLSIRNLLPPLIIPGHVADLYEQAFPAEERRNLTAQQVLLNSGALRLGLLENSEQFAGFVFYWQLTDFVFIEHFAVSPEQRGAGIGSAVMQALEADHRKLVLEVELPHTIEAQRRIRFYEGLGFKAYAFNYLQPPYQAGGAPLPMLLMQKGMPPEEHTFTKISNEIYLEVYGC